MTVSLLHSTPLNICSKAIRTCWDSHNLSDNGGEKDKALIARVGNKMKHESVKNHIHYTFDVGAISTKTLLALTRHDVGTEFSVQSTRYTCNKSDLPCTPTNNTNVNVALVKIMEIIDNVKASCDDRSMLLPQAYNYNLVATFSMTALQHFLELRLKKGAHWDIQELANKLYEAIPEDHKYLFEDYIKNESST
jgi:thymidylate synthase (FAD)